MLKRLKRQLPLITPMKGKSKIIETAGKYRQKIDKKLRRISRRHFWRQKINWPPIIKTALILAFCAALFAEYLDSKKTVPPILEAPAAPAAGSLEAKIGQMIMVGFRGAEISAESKIAQDIKDFNLGGVILFDYDIPSKNPVRNIINFGQTKKLIGDLKNFSNGQPLLVAVDAEGGRVNRLKPEFGFAQIPSAQSLEKLDGSMALENYWDLAKQLADLGFNVNFAPVVDLNLNPQNPVIGGLERSYSKKPAIVSTLAKSMIAAHKSFGIITSLKHFPGHGSSKNDSHQGLVDITKTYQEIELAPYESLIKDAAVDSVMTAHVINRNIDPNYPATLSPEFIEIILRQKLGFDGVVFSDDMQMGAIVDNYEFEDAIVRAINAGCDILVFSNNGAEYDENVAKRARDTILSAVNDNRISPARIERSYSRIMKLKEKLK